MLSGKIKRLVIDKGFGFIAQDGPPTGKEFFFHRSGCADDVIFEMLNEGEAVTFEPEMGPKGPRAEKVARK